MSALLHVYHFFYKTRKNFLDINTFLVKIGYILYTEEIFTVPLQRIDVQVSINGLIASVKSELHYVSDKDENTETVFVFPLDSDAAVYEFEAEIDGKTIVAEVQEKSQVLHGI